MNLWVKRLFNSLSPLGRGKGEGETPPLLTSHQRGRKLVNMDLKNKIIAVTGASGMLGVYICRALLAEGARVRGVVRNPQKAAFLEEEGVVFARADLNDRSSLTKAFHGVEALISNAALYSMKKMLAWEENYRANKIGTENVYEAAHQAGLKRIVHISTFGVYKLRIGRAVTEDSPQYEGEKREGGAYRATKQMSEALAWNLAKKYGFQLTTLRPPAIYGARDPNFMNLFKKFMRGPVLPMPTKAIPLVYAGDVAQAVVASLKNDASGGRAYNTGNTNNSLYDFARVWKRVSGHGPLLIPLPMPVGLVIDSSRAERELGFCNRPFVEGLREIMTQEGL